MRGRRSHSNSLYACVIINFLFIANFARVNTASCVSASIVIMAKKCTTRCSVLLSVIRALLRVHCVVTHLLLAHVAILYVARLSNKITINRMVHAAHAHISFDVSQLYTPTVMDSWSSEGKHAWQLPCVIFWNCFKNLSVGETLKVFIYLMENSVLVLHGASTCMYMYT